MTCILWLVCDASGSMSEGGKRFIVRGLVEQVAQYFRLGYGGAVDVRLAEWSEHVAISSWSSSEETQVPLLVCGGVAEGDSLGEFFSDHEGSRFLLITDGAWSEKSRRTVQSWRDRLGADSLFVITVGHDRSRSIRGPGVGIAEDLLGLLQGWLAP